VKEADRRRGPYPYYGASGIVDHVDGYLFEGEYLLIAEDGENLRTRQTPVAFLASGKFWVNNHAHIVRGNNTSDTRFLMYALRATDISGYLTGSTMPKLTQGNMNRIPVVAPPPREQRAIAEVLGALDDKIELNRRMNRTLEQLAAAVFKAWFVDFEPVKAKAAGAARFPTMPQPVFDALPTTFTDSPLGPIPHGWRVGSLAELAEIGSGQRPAERSTERTDDLTVPLYGGGGVMAYVREPLFTRPILLTGRVGTLGEVFRITRPCWASDNTLVIRPAGDVHYEFLYFHLRAIDFSSLNRGSTQPLVTQSDVKKQNVVVPPVGVVAAYHSLAHALFMRLDHNDAESETLAAIRDALLPKLLSGEIRVKTAAQAVGEVA
jgi:type I restriction enzyme S subunit